MLFALSGSAYIFSYIVYLSVGATYSFALSSGLLPSLDSELCVEDAFLVAAFLAAHRLLVHL